MADTREVTATLVINFGSATSNNDGLVAEIDSRPDGLNAGKTSFAPGDDVFILLYKTSNVTLNTPVTSWGNLIFQAPLTPLAIAKTDDIQFVDEVEATLRYPIPAGGFTGSWMGTDYGAVTARTEVLVGITRPVAPHFAGAYRVNWSPEAQVYKLTNTALAGFTEYPIIVYFTGVAA